MARALAKVHSPQANELAPLRSARRMQCPETMNALIAAAREELDAATEAAIAADRYYHHEQPRDVPNENKIAALRYSLKCRDLEEAAWREWMLLVDPEAFDDPY